MPNAPRPTMFLPMSQRSILSSEDITPVVNGDARPVAHGSSLGDLLRSLELDPHTVVIEYNGEVLRDRSAYDSLQLATGDNIEIVHFVGGG